MGDGIIKGLSINVKSILLILLFVDIGFTIKMINKYHAMRDAGYVRKRTFEENMEKRVMKAFGSAEEMKKIVKDATQQKLAAEKTAASLIEKDKKIRRTNRKLMYAKTQLLSEKSLLLRDKNELKKKLEAAEVEIFELKRKILKLQPL